MVGEESEDEEEEMVEADDDVDGFAVEVDGHGPPRRRLRPHRRQSRARDQGPQVLAPPHLLRLRARDRAGAPLRGGPRVEDEEGARRVAQGADQAGGGSLLTKFIQGALEQKALVEALVDMCGACGLVDVFVHFLNDLYDRDILPQEVILAWADEAEEEDDDGSADARCLANAKDMIEWLREPDDDDDDDDDDDE